MNRKGIISGAVLLLVMSFFSMTPALAETIYKWTDDKGTVHFGERPPEGVDAELVSVTTASAASSNAAADPYAAARENLRSPAEAREANAETAKQRELQKQEDARIAAACEAQKSRLQELIPRSKVLLQNPDGTSRMLSDDERQSMIDESQKFVDENCR